MKQTNFPDATKRNRLKVGRPNNGFWLVVIIVGANILAGIVVRSLSNLIEHYFGETIALIAQVLMAIFCILCLFWIALSVGTGTGEKDFKQFEE